MDSKKKIVTKIFDEASQKFDKIGTPFFKYFGEAMVDFPLSIRMIVSWI
jgi:hypothetical protein